MGERRWYKGQGLLAGMGGGRGAKQRTGRAQNESTIIPSKSFSPAAPPCNCASLQSPSSQLLRSHHHLLPYTWPV